MMMKSAKFVIDADGCPVVRIAAGIAKEYSAECVKQGAKLQQAGGRTKESPKRREEQNDRFIKTLRDLLENQG